MARANERSGSLAQIEFEVGDLVLVDVFSNSKNKLGIIIAEPNALEGVYPYVRDSFYHVYHTDTLNPGLYYNHEMSLISGAE